MALPCLVLPGITCLGSDRVEAVVLYLLGETLYLLSHCANFCWSVYLFYRVKPKRILMSRQLQTSRVLS